MLNKVNSDIEFFKANYVIKTDKKSIKDTKFILDAKILASIKLAMTNLVKKIFANRYKEDYEKARQDLFLYLILAIRVDNEIIVNIDGVEHNIQYRHNRHAKGII